MTFSMGGDWRQTAMCYQRQLSVQQAAMRFESISVVSRVAKDRRHQQLGLLSSTWHLARDPINACSGLVLCPKSEFKVSVDLETRRDGPGSQYPRGVA